MYSRPGRSRRKLVSVHRPEVRKRGRRRRRAGGAGDVARRAGAHHLTANPPRRQWGNKPQRSCTRRAFGLGISARWRRPQARNIEYEIRLPARVKDLGRCCATQAEPRRFLSSRTRPHLPRTGRRSRSASPQGSTSGGSAFPVYKHAWRQHRGRTVPTWNPKTSRSQVVLRAHLASSKGARPRVSAHAWAVLQSCSRGCKMGLDDGAAGPIAERFDTISSRSASRMERTSRRPDRSSGQKGERWCGRRAATTAPSGEAGREVAGAFGSISPWPGSSRACTPCGDRLTCIRACS